MTGVYGAAVMRVTACRTEPIAAERIDPNTATAAGLMRLPGVGRTRAMDIIAARPYRTAAELDRVRGIGPKTMEKITPYVAVENSDEQRKK